MLIALCSVLCALCFALSRNLWSPKLCELNLRHRADQGEAGQRFLESFRFLCHLSPDLYGYRDFTGWSHFHFLLMTFTVTNYPHYFSQQTSIILPKNLLLLSSWYLFSALSPEKYENIPFNCHLTFSLIHNILESLISNWPYVIVRAHLITASNLKVHFVQYMTVQYVQYLKFYNVW